MSRERVDVDIALLIFAFRYALGRMTYAPSMVADAIREHKDKFSPQYKQLIIDETTIALNSEQYGMQCDKETWERLVEELRE